MIDPKLFEYISVRRGQGASDEEIKKALLGEGWKETAVAEALLPGAYPSAPSPEALAIADASDIFFAAWQKYRGHWELFVSITAVALLPSIFSGVYFAGEVSKSVQAKMGFAFFVSAGFLVGLLAIIVSSIGQIALLYAMRDAEKGMTFSGAFALAMEKILSYWWLALLSGMIIFGGILLLFVPGVLCALWFSMMVYVFVEEDLRGMDALLRSKEYMKGQVGAVIWRSIVFAFFAVFASMIFSGIFAIFGAPSFLTEAGIPQALFSLVLTPVSYLFGYGIYHELVRVKKVFTLLPDQSAKKFFTGLGIFGIVAVVAIIIAAAYFLIKFPIPHEAWVKGFSRP